MHLFKLGLNDDNLSICADADVNWVLFWHCQSTYIHTYIQIMSHAGGERL